MALPKRPPVGLSVEDRKKRLKQLLHIARGQLAMDEDTYRMILVGVSKDPLRNSSSLLSLQELELAVDRMKASGFKVRKTASKPQQDDHPLIRKIRSLWLTLRDQGVLRDPSDKALAKYVEGETGVAQLAWLSTAQCHQVIERMKKWIDRKEVAPNE